MRKFISFTAIILISLLFIRCVDKTNNPVPEPPDYIIGINDTVTFRVGEKAFIQPADLEIGFDHVVSDTRCPEGYICLYPGPGMIRIWIKRPGMDTIFANTGVYWCGLVPNDRGIRPVDTLGLRFSLIALYPCPTSFDPVPQDEYLAWMEVKTFNSGLSYVDSVIITDLPSDSIELDPYEYFNPTVLGDTLKIDIPYSGGCEEHDFRLYMSPAAFVESNPVQADLYLRHDANGDLCEALIRRSLYFDLSPISKLHEDIYGFPDTIIIKIHYYRQEYGQIEWYIPGDLKK